MAASVPEREFEETEHKAAAMRRAIEQAAEAMVAPMRPGDGPATSGPAAEARSSEVTPA